MKKDREITLLDQQPILASRFRFVQVLGRGAAGAVYRVRDCQMDNREVALKILRNKRAFDQNTLKRFIEEVKLCQNIKHPNLVEAYELLEIEDAIAYTMEFVDGSDLRIFLGNEPLQDKMIDVIFDQLLLALDALHRNGIVHRDVKLENVMINSKGVVKLTDLGLAKNRAGETLTGTGIRLGTLQYMPPEYLRLAEFDVRSDIYMAGMALYELLTGSRRLGDLPGYLALNHLIKNKFKTPKIEREGISQKYHYLIAKSLNPYPEKRFQSALEMRDIFVNPEALKDKDLSIIKRSVALKDRHLTSLQTLGPGADRRKLVESRVLLTVLACISLAVIVFCLVIMINKAG